MLALVPPQEPVYPKYTPNEEKEVAWRRGYKEGSWWHVDGKLTFPKQSNGK
jgi:hypothetical protein